MFPAVKYSILAFKLLIIDSFKVYKKFEKMVKLYVYEEQLEFFTDCLHYKTIKAEGKTHFHLTFRSQPTSLIISVMGQIYLHKLSHNCNPPP